jgi:cytochrome c-type biogenesis protein CcmE
MKNRITFIIAGIAIVAGVIFLLLTATAQESHFFITVSELNSLAADERQKTSVLSGAVDGQTISYDASAPELKFTIVDIPADMKEVEKEGGLSLVLQNAVNDPTAQRLDVVYHGVKPDLLKDDVQVIMSGKMGDDGRFYADDLLLKCPSKYAEDIPEQIDE